MLTKDRAGEIIRQIITHTGGSATVTLNDSTRATTRFANSQISQNISIRDTVASLTVYDGKREATATTNVLTPEGMKQLAAEAMDMLKIVPDGEFNAFPFSQEKIADVESDGTLAKKYDADARAAIIKEGVAQVKPGYTAAGAFALNKRVLAVGNGEALRYAEFDQVEFNTVVTHEGGAAGSADASIYSTPKGGTNAVEINPVTPKLFAEAQEVASRSHSPVALPLGAHTVVLSPSAVANLMMFVGWSLSSKLIEDGVSFAVGKLGEKIFGNNINLTDDFKLLGSCPLPFDAEGNLRTALPLIENGVIKNYVNCNKTAAKAGTKLTGHAMSNKGQGGYPSNLSLAPGDKSLAEIIKGTERGVYISEFHYTNFINPRTLQITGLTRNGACLIEDGKLGKAIITTRFTQSLIDALSAVVEISSDRVLMADDGLMPGMKIEGFNFTGSA